MFSVETTVKSILSVFLCYGLMGSSSALAEEIQRSFTFSNGKVATFTFGDSADQSFQIHLSDPAALGSPVMVRSGKSLKVIQAATEAAEPADIKFKVQVLSPVLTTHHFTYFSTGEGNFLLFEDGTVAKSCASNLDTMSAALVTIHSNRVLVESHSNSRLNLTQVSKDLEKPECAVVDSRYHPDISEYYAENETAARWLSQGIVSLPNSPMMYDIGKKCFMREFHHASESFFLKSCDSLPPWQPGVFVARASDSKALRINPTPKALALASDEEIKIEDGILTVKGLWKRVDLIRFNEELRRFASLGSLDKVYGDKGTIDDPVDEMRKFAKDMVAESRREPSLYQEIADPAIMIEMAEALRAKRSVAVLGKAGTGKSSAIRAFAREVGLGHIPGIPRTLEIYEMDVNNLMAGTKWVGTSEQRLSVLLAASKHLGSTYFIDEVHTLSGAGTHSENSNDITQGMKKPMEDGRFVLIGASTHHEFYNAFSKDPAFLGRFDEVRVNSPGGKDLGDILQARMLTADPTLTFASDSIAEAVRLSSEYDITGAQPRAAINLLKKAHAQMETSGEIGSPMGIADLRRAAIKKYGFDPVHFDKSRILERLAGLKHGLDEVVIGQEAAKKAIVSVWKRKFSKVGEPTQVQSILLVGPPGVGKTRIAEASAELMGYEKTVIEMNKFRAGGADVFRRQIYAELLKNQFRVFILDEFEKASPSVQESALSLLQSGEFVVEEEVSKGRIVSREVNARNAMFMLTSNAGGRLISSAVAKIPHPQLVGELAADGVSEPILSRLQYIVPLNYPTEDEFKTAVAYYLEKTLKRESEKHRVTFQLNHGKEMIKHTAKILKKKQDRLKSAGSVAEGTGTPVTDATPMVAGIKSPSPVEASAEFVDAMAKGYVRGVDYRDIKRLMIPIEEQMSDKLLDPALVLGSEIFLDWDESMAPETFESVRNYADRTFYK